VAGASDHSACIGGAFVEGMQVAATISAVLALAVAIMAVALLRNVRSGDQPVEDRPADRARSSAPTPIAVRLDECGEAAA
jgi:cytochrome c-type biogenesis protein CcmH/NrfG